MSVLRADPGGILRILDELPDPASYPAEVLAVRRVEAGRLVTARYRRMCWAHATDHYRLLVKLCTVAGRVQQDLVNRLVRCGPPERSVHRTWFWLREGEAVAAPPCAVCGRPMDSRAGASAASLGPHARDRQQPDAAMGDAPTRAPEG